jgi:CrcB protein
MAFLLEPPGTGLMMPTAPWIEGWWAVAKPPLLLQALVRLGEDFMSGYGILAVGIGAALGAWLRWALGLLCNALFPPIPPGTLFANLIGAYIIGCAVGAFSEWPGLAPEWQLLVVTGFCGGLTTFSTFSAEISALAQQSRFAIMAGAIGLHVGGSLALTLLGIASVRWIVAR